MIVPSLRSHLYRHEQTGYTKHAGKSHIIGLELLLEHIVESQHTKTTPYSVCIERTGIGIVALTRLLRSLVKIEHDGKTSHEEEEEYHPELAYATLSAPSLPEQSDKSQQQRQTVEHVVSLIFLQFLRQLALVAKHPVVDKRDTRYPVAVLRLSTTLQVILSTGKVPHEVAPVHEVALVREEETYVVPLCRHLHSHLLATAVVGHVSTRNATQPTLVSLSVSRRMHTWEQHVLSVNELVLVRYYEVRVLLCVRSLLLALPNGSTFLTLRNAHVAVNVKSHLRGVCLTVKQRRIAILVTTQIRTEREHIFGRVLVHRRIGSRTNHDNGIARIANHQHKHAQQGSILETSRHYGHELLVCLLAIVESEVDGSKDDDANDGSTPSHTTERNAQHTYSKCEREVLTLEVAVGIRFIYSPYHDGYEQDDIDNLACIERTA